MMYLFLEEAIKIKQLRIDIVPSFKIGFIVILFNNYWENFHKIRIMF